MASLPTKQRLLRARRAELVALRSAQSKTAE
jgi:hypothetical protein